MMVEAVPASFVAFLALCPSLSEPSTGSFQHPHSLCHWWSSGDELIKPIRFVCNAMAEDQHQQLSELRRRRHDEWRGATGVPDDEPSPAEMEAEDTSADEAFARRLQEELNAEVDDDDGSPSSPPSTSPTATERGEPPANLATMAGRLAYNTAGFLATSLVQGATALLGGGRSGQEQQSGGDDGLSQIERDEAFARRLQAEEDARSMGMETSAATRRTVTPVHTLDSILQQLGGFAVGRRRQQAEGRDDSSGQGQATATERRVREIILPGFGSGIRVRLVTSRSDGNPAVVPMPLSSGGSGRQQLRIQFPTSALPDNHPLHQMLQHMQFGNQMSYEELLELQERMGQVDRGASEEAISSLPTRTYGGGEASSSMGAGGDNGGASTASSDQTTCAICLEDYAQGSEVKTLPCMHNFCKDCIDRWLVKNKSCPVCKKDIC